MLNKYQTSYLYQLCHINLPSRLKITDTEKSKTFTIVDNDCIDEKQCKIVRTKIIDKNLDNCGILRKALKGDFILSVNQNFIKGDLTAAFIEEDVLVTDNFVVLTPKENIDPNIFMWAFHQEYVLSQIKPLNIGRKFFQVSIDELSKILIPTHIYYKKKSE